MEAAREAGAQYFTHRSDNLKCQIPEESANDFTQCITNRLTDTNSNWNIYTIECDETSKQKIEGM